MPFIKVNDIKMYYEIHGQGDPLVLIEGFTCNRFYWEPFIPALSKRFQVLIFDNRGSGETDTPPGPYTIKMMAKDAVGLIDALHIRHPYVLGQSMGGAILQQICLDFPQKVKKGIVCSSASKFSQQAIFQFDLRVPLEESGIKDELYLKTLLPWLCSNTFLSKPENIDKIISGFLATPYPQSLAGYLAQADALRSFDITADLPSIHTPLLIAAGDEDILTLISCSQLLAKKIPNAKLVIFEGQGHLFVQEKVQETTDMMLSFFKR